MIWSILIPTLAERRNQFERLHARLRTQIVAHGLAAEVEILSLCDDREHSIGHKRNQLVAQSQAEFVAFVDDDDEVSERYVPSIYGALRQNPGIDCIGMVGVVTFQGQQPRRFVHSLRYQQYFSRGGVYYRPPYHLNPIRRQIAARYAFAEVSYGEDVDWAMRICGDGALQQEVFIDEPLYFYDSRRSWRYQRLLDLSEGPRHALGLQFANSLRLRRWLRALFATGAV